MTKPTKWHYRLANTQVGLGIRPVWSVFDVHMKKAWVLIANHWAHSEDWSESVVTKRTVILLVLAWAGSILNPWWANDGASDVEMLHLKRDPA